MCIRDRSQIDYVLPMRRVETFTDYKSRLNAGHHSGQSRPTIPMWATSCDAMAKVHLTVCDMVVRLSLPRVTAWLR